MSKINTDLNKLTPKWQYVARMAKAMEDVPEKIGFQRFPLTKAFCLEYPEYDNIDGYAAVSNVFSKGYIPVDKEDLMLKVESFCQKVREGSLSIMSDQKSAA